jgi:hypothetical protein
MLTRSIPADARGADADIKRRAPTEPELQKMRRMVDAVVQAFYADARPHLKGRLIVIVDGRRDGLTGPEDLAGLERAYLIQRLRDGGADVHDLEPLYADHVRRSSRRLEVGPYDGHLNSIGVHIAMKAAANALVEPARP